jgi:AraC-like DNA-binding protein
MLADEHTPAIAMTVTRHTSARQNTPAAVDQSLYHPSVVMPMTLYHPGTHADGESSQEELHFALRPNLLLPLDIRCVGRSDWQPGTRIERQRAAGCSIELVTAGQGFLRVNRAHYALAPHDVFILHPGEHQCYGTAPGAPLHKCFVSFAEDNDSINDIMTRLDLMRVSHVRLPAAAAARIATAFAAMLRLFRDRPRGYRRVCSSRIYDVLLQLAAARHGMEDDPRLPPVLEQAMAAVVADLASVWTVARVARRAGCTPEHLNRLMKRHVDMHAHEWLEQLRLHHAARSLRETRAHIHEIGARVGYADPYYFSKAFRRVTGMTPTQYRRRCAQVHACAPSARRPRA